MIVALTPIDETHALQIQAGTIGRKAGHAFEDEITVQINKFTYPRKCAQLEKQHVYTGDPASLLINYIASYYGADVLSSATAISTGALATSEEGQKWLSINGAGVHRCKSDIVVTFKSHDSVSRTVGVSTKQCNNDTPTNAQLFFTTARGFVNLLRANGIEISDNALQGLRQFCGDKGFRPLDDNSVMNGRKVDPRRYFWEEIDPEARNEWENLLHQHQSDVTTLLLQKAYMDDPFIPEFLIHKTRKAANVETTEVAIYAIDELVSLSCRYQGVVTKPYKVNKGSFRDPEGTQHLAPRFGIVQMQRGGQAQHPDQLQFNLEAGYFYNLEKLIDDV